MSCEPATAKRTLTFDTAAVQFFLSIYFLVPGYSNIFWKRDPGGQEQYPWTDFRVSSSYTTGILPFGSFFCSYSGPRIRLSAGQTNIDPLYNTVQYNSNTSLLPRTSSPRPFCPALRKLDVAGYLSRFLRQILAQLLLTPFLHRSLEAVDISPLSPFYWNNHNPWFVGS